MHLRNVHPETIPGDEVVVLLAIRALPFARIYVLDPRRAFDFPLVDRMLPVAVFTKGLRAVENRPTFRAFPFPGCRIKFVLPLRSSAAHAFIVGHLCATRTKIKQGTQNHLQHSIDAYYVQEPGQFPNQQRLDAAGGAVHSHLTNDGTYTRYEQNREIGTVFLLSGVAGQQPHHSRLRGLCLQPLGQGSPRLHSPRA